MGFDTVLDQPGIDPEVVLRIMVDLQQCDRQGLPRLIRHLPHDLVEAFRSTLQETSEAHLLLHVIDASDENRDAQIEEVESVLEQIQADKVHRIQIMNKIDINGTEPRVDYDAEGQARRIWLSAHSGQGLDLFNSFQGFYAIHTTRHLHVQNNNIKEFFLHEV